MTSISGRTACAKRGGPNFLETKRVDAGTGNCPPGLVPCSYFTSMTSTVCMLKAELEEQCPIIDLFVVDETNVPELRENGFTITTGGYTKKGGSQ